ncbi:MAG: cytochrome c3 family protein [Candidatus Marinimicrobia bacterium]|nr:cytochrome c3 family protein [Candidatus Neomarinimicrobiota bacterium]
MKFILVFSGLFLGLIVVIFLSLEYTSKPAFCSTCHFMQPYVDSWKTSTHSEVMCTDCHFPPGLKAKLKGKITAASMVVNYFTGVYKKSKPWAEIEDASCLRSDCHEQGLLKGKILFNEGIIFDHEPHVTKLRREKKLRCTSCHSQIVQGDHMTVTESTCFLCHFKNQPKDTRIDDCTWCHEAPVGTDPELLYDHTFILNQKIGCKKCHGSMQVGDGAVTVERCSSCHAEISKIERINEVEFIHLNHVTNHKVECQNCHSIIQHKSVPRTEEIIRDCQSCHENSHLSQYYLFSGTGGKNIPSHPNPMYEGGLNCQACHVFHGYDGDSKILGQTMEAKAESCEICHGEGYNKILDQWEKLMLEKMERTEQALSIVKTEMQMSYVQSTTRQQVETLVEEIRFNYQLVKDGNIVHNVVYSDELLLSVHRNLKSVLKSLNSQKTIPDISSYGKIVPSECINCHFGMEDVTVSVFDIYFSHNIHIVKNHLTCSQCHSNRTQHGELLVSRNDCLSCHHTQEEKDCQTCHALQESIYSGSISLIDGGMPDVMYEEDVTCRDCHENEYEKIVKSPGGSCISCHDDEYQDWVDTWQKESKELIENIEFNLSRFVYNDLKNDELMIINNVKSGIDNIRKDKSFGVHNIELIQKVLAEYTNQLVKIGKKIIY